MSFIFRKFITRHATPCTLALGLLLGSHAPWTLANGPGSATATVLVIGDSLSAAHQIPPPQGWVALLEKQLQREELDYRVVNASISGDTTLGGLNRLPAALARHSPRIVILELGANDGLRGLPITAMRQNLETMIRLSKDAGARVLLIGMQLPPNYGPDYTRSFQETYQTLATSHRLALVPFLLERVATRRELMQDDNLHPTAAAQPLLLETVWSALRPLL